MGGKVGPGLSKVSAVIQAVVHSWNKAKCSWYNSSDDSDVQY